MSIEGIPDGWELVRIGKPFINERYISLSGKVTNCVCIPSGEGYAIVRKIEKPKKPKKYRPFASAAEFAPHFDRSLQLGAVLDVVMRVLKYDEAGIFVITKMGLGFVAYEDAFLDFKFTDGTLFGIEVTE